MLFLVVVLLCLSLWSVVSGVRPSFPGEFGALQLGSTDFGDLDKCPIWFFAESSFLCVYCGFEQGNRAFGSSGP